MLWTLFEAARDLLRSAYRIEVVQQDEQRLILDCGGREVIAERGTQSVRFGTKVLARFDAIRSIEVEHHRRQGDGNPPEYWSVSLRVGQHSRVLIGRSRDDADASIAAARLSTITGKRVLVA